MMMIVPSDDDNVGNSGDYDLNIDLNSDLSDINDELSYENDDLH